MINKQKICGLDWKPISFFLVIAFVPAWILFSLPAVFQAAGLEKARLMGLAGWSAAMWMPGLGAVLTTLIRERRPIQELGLSRLGNLKIYFWAWLVPLLTTILAGIFTWLLGWGDVDTSFTIQRQGLNGATELPLIDSPLMLGVIIAASLVLGPVFNSLFALGEELGWRGYLLPKLMPLGQVPAVLITGIIWGIWHAPAILQGHNYPEHPLLGVGMMVVFTILVGVFLSWLFLKTNSPWAPALGHGSLNAVASMNLLFLSDVDLALGGTLTSVSGWMALAIVIWILIGSGEFPLKKGDYVSRETKE